METKDQKYIDFGDKRGKILKSEFESGFFKCAHCGKEVGISDGKIGTKNRNHCPYCLWSQHVDLEESGDRKTDCLGNMEPIGLTFKQEGFDKWGKKKQGEIMLIHRCDKCGRISINRLASDDEVQNILAVYEKSKGDAEVGTLFEKEGINLLNAQDEGEIKRQLFGK